MKRRIGDGIRAWGRWAGCLLAGVVAVGAGLPMIQMDALCRMPVRPVPLAPGRPAASTRKMAERLDQIRQNAAPESMAYLSDRLAPVLEEALNARTNLMEQAYLAMELGATQTRAGRPDSGLNTFARLEKLLAENGRKLDSRGRVDLRMRKVTAYLRLGEQENCQALHGPEACLFPLRPAAYHQLPRGSRSAIQLLNEQLQEFPQDLASRWLLNLAHMTLGEYPDRVPLQWLIPPSAFESEYELPRFPDVAGALGLDVEDLAGGVIVDDFDNDGNLDVVASSWSLSGPLRFFHNDGNGQFTERTSEAGLVGLTGGLNIMQTDYNNDGWLDIWIPRGAWLGKAGRIPNSLLRNNGDGTFTDVTEEVGLLSFHPTQSSRWFDYDGDGRLDLFVGNESTDPNDPDWCELFHNNADGTFTECARISGLGVAKFVKGVACADYDNDGRPDLYLSCMKGSNLLFHNDGPAGTNAAGAVQWKFTEVSRIAGVTEPMLSFPTWFFDYDNDGWEDLFCSGYGIRNVGDIAADYLGLPTQAAMPKLYHNNHDGTFTDVTTPMRINRVCHTMGCNYGDLDNDGWLDFYCATGDPDLLTLVPNRMFRNNGGKGFQEVTTATGTGHIQKGHGVAFADLDNDGDQDVYVVMGGAMTGDVARNALFLNPGSTNHWLKLKLVGTQANRPAIGARIKLTLETPSGRRELHRVVSSGASFGSNPLRQEIGLGDATAVTMVEIRWPGSRRIEFIENLAMDQAYEVQEGRPTPVPMRLKVLHFNTGVAVQSPLQSPGKL